MDSESTNQDASPMETDAINCSIENNDDDDVFKRYYSTNDVLLRTPSYKRAANFSPERSRKRLSTSSNDITKAEIVENKLTLSMKPPNSLNLTLSDSRERLDLFSPDPRDVSVLSFIESRPTLLNQYTSEPRGALNVDSKVRLNSSLPEPREPPPQRPNQLNLSLPVSNEPQPRKLLHRSMSSKVPRKCYQQRMATAPTTPLFSPTTPQRQKRFRTPTVSRTPTLSLRHAALNRTFSVRTPTKPVMLRRLNSETGGSISQLHSSQLNRTYSGFFKRNRAVSTCTIAQTPTLKRNGSVRIVSSKVKRCHSTASLQRRKVYRFLLIDTCYFSLAHINYKFYLLMLIQLFAS